MRQVLSWRWLCLLAVLVTLAATGQTPGQIPFTARVDVVRFQVGVTGAAGPLTADEFEVRVGGQLRELLSVNFVDVQRSVPSENELEPGGALGAAAVDRTGSVGVAGADARRFVFFFDLARMDRQAFRNARNAAKEFVREQLRTSDLLALVTYSGRQGLRYAVPLTREHDRLLIEFDKDYLSSARASDSSGGDIPVASLVEALQQLPGAEQGAEAAAWVQELDLTRAAMSAESLLSALRGFLESLGGIEGRKHLLFFSRGFHDALLADPGGRRELERVARVAREAEVTLHTFQPQTMPVSEVNAPENMQSLWRPGSDRSPWAAPVGYLMGDRSVHHFLAAETGGSSNFYRHTLATGLRSLEARTRSYYVLTLAVQSEDPATLDLDVRLRRPDVEVAWAPATLSIGDGRGSRDERTVRVAEALELGTDVHDLSFALATVPLPAKDGFSRLAIALEIHPDAISAARSGDTVEFEILGLAVTPWATAADHFRAALRFRVPPEPEVPFRYTNVLLVPEGSYYVKVMVRDRLSGRLGARSVRYDVAQASGAAHASLPLIVRVERTRQVLDGTAGQPPAHRTGLPIEDPFRVGDLPLTPVVAETLTWPGAELRVWTTIHPVPRDVETGEPRFGLRLELLDGERAIPLDNSQIVRAATEPAAAFMSILIRTVLPENLAPGAYRLGVLVDDGNLRTTTASLGGTVTVRSLPESESGDPRKDPARAVLHPDEEDESQR